MISNKLVTNCTNNCTLTFFEDILLNDTQAAWAGPPSSDVPTFFENSVLVPLSIFNANFLPINDEKNNNNDIQATFFDKTEIFSFSRFSDGIEIQILK